MIGEISTKKSSISQLNEQKSSKLSAYKKEESIVEEQREKVHGLKDQYEENMRAITEKLESKPSKFLILKFFPLNKFELINTLLFWVLAVS